MKPPFRFWFCIPFAMFPFVLTSCSSQGVRTAAQYSIGGTVANLAGNGGGLTLQDNGGDNLMVNSNGNFQFLTMLPAGTAYKVTVSNQPTAPAQTCGITNASGAANSAVINITVDCGHNEWAWVTGSKSVNLAGTYGTMGMPAATNTPGGRQCAATWADNSGNLWLFGGYGYDTIGNLLPMSDLWRFSISNRQWTWISGPTVGGQNGIYGTLGVPGTNNSPGARAEASSWTDSAGNFWLFGGDGFDAVGNETPMNDLWKYAGGQWTWMGGSNIGMQNGIYGVLGVAADTNMPGGRFAPVIWPEASGDIWMLGGLGYDETNPINGELNDLWKLSNGVWTWMGGSKLKQQPGIYGTLGTPSPNNIPGARYGASGWTDSSGDFWVFGGYAFDSRGAISQINDQWKYSGGQWTWVAGPNVVNQHGTYGTMGIPAAANIPGGRQSSATWVDASGNAWMFGGNGFDSAGAAPWLNDLWKFSGGEWTWIGGANAGSQIPTYGTQGTLFPGNTPGGRFFLTQWVDRKGNLWLFGGYGESPGAVLGNLNDLWMYEP